MDAFRGQISTAGRGGVNLSYEIGVEVAASSALLPVATIPLLTTGTILIRALWASAGAGRQGLLLQGGGDNLGGEVEELTEVDDSLVGEVPIVPLPTKLLPDVSAGTQGLHGLDDLEVGDLKVVVLGGIEILGGDEDSL